MASNMLKSIAERLRSIFTSKPDENQQHYKIEVPRLFITAFSVVFTAILAYNRMFKLIVVIVTIFASAFYVRYFYGCGGFLIKPKTENCTMKKNC